MSVELNIFIRTKAKQDIVLQTYYGSSTMYHIFNEGAGSYDTEQRLTEAMANQLIIECDKQIATMRRHLGVIRSTEDLNAILEYSDEIDTLETCHAELLFFKDLVVNLGIDPDVEGLFFSYD